MGYELVANGGVLNAASLVQHENQLPEGKMVKLGLDLRLPVSQDIASGLESKLKQAGIPDVSVTTASPVLNIYFRKGFPWLVVIAAAILASIALAILIVGWRLYREVVPESLQPIGGVMLLVLIGLGIVLLVRRR